MHSCAAAPNSTSDTTVFPAFWVRLLLGHCGSPLFLECQLWVVIARKMIQGQGCVYFCCFRNFPRPLSLWLRLKYFKLQTKLWNLEDSLKAILLPYSTEVYFSFNSHKAFSECYFRRKSKVERPRVPLQTKSKGLSILSAFFHYQHSWTAWKVKVASSRSSSIFSVT